MEGEVKVTLWTRKGMEVGSSLRSSEEQHYPHPLLQVIHVLRTVA
jgi:hypothetical protein